MRHYLMIALAILLFCSTGYAHEGCDKPHAKHYTVCITKCVPPPMMCHVHPCPCCRGLIIHEPHWLPRFRGCHTHTRHRLIKDHRRQHSCYCCGKPEKAACGCEKGPGGHPIIEDKK